MIALALRLWRQYERLWSSLCVRAMLSLCGKGLVCGSGVRVIGGRGIALGADVTLVGGNLLAASDGRITIGDNCAFNLNSIIDASQGGQIDIGNKVLIGPNVVLRASDHAHTRTDVFIADQGHTGGVIRVEDGVWIGANVVVTRNVTIGAHSIVAAGAVVTRDLPPYSIAAGVPARVIRDRRESISNMIGWQHERE